MPTRRHRSSTVPNPLPAVSLTAPPNSDSIGMSRMDDATLIEHGHHFGRTINTFTCILRLIKHGRFILNVLHSQQLSVADLPETEQVVWRTYRSLLSMLPQLESIHSISSLTRISKLIGRGIIAGRLDDKKMIRDNIFIWLTDAFGDDALGVAHLDKQDRGLNHPFTGALLCPIDLDWDDPLTQEAIKAGSYKALAWSWPLFVYDWGLSLGAENMWQGRFRSSLLVAMDLGGKTQPGDCCIYGMTHVTPRSIAYIIMQVHFALSSCRFFTVNDALTSSREIYESTITFFKSSSNATEMRELLVWWDE
ncbi:hypothetical protein DXG01_013596 [Tephrocybe rancida]|nr:hypothetical protein DXG01_013596 [Tephrocybe rancida]